MVVHVGGSATAQGGRGSRCRGRSGGHGGSGDHFLFLFRSVSLCPLPDVDDCNLLTRAVCAS